MHGLFFVLSNIALVNSFAVHSNIDKQFHLAWVASKHIESAHILSHNFNHSHVLNHQKADHEKDENKPDHIFEKPSWSLAYARYALQLLGDKGFASMSQDDLGHYLKSVKNEKAILQIKAMQKNIENHEESIFFKEMNDLLDPDATFILTDKYKDMVLFKSLVDKLVQETSDSELKEFFLQLAVMNFFDQSAQKTLLRKDYIGLWISMCGPILNEIPSQLQDFKIKFGDYRFNRHWSRDFVLNSMVKHKLRKVYRHKKKGLVVAETFSDEGELEETEVTYRNPQNQLMFLLYNKHGELRPFGRTVNHLGKKFLNLNPQSCFGCHFNSTTLEFDVVRPNADLLKLRSYFLAEDVKNKRLKLIKNSSGAR